MHVITEQRLTYICDSPNEYRNPVGKKIMYALYDCTCGLVVEKRKADVTRNKVRSCNDCNGHGMTGSRIYRIWKAMKTRTTNPNYSEYHYYGGKGVRLCKRWQSFDNFYKDMGKAYDEHVTEYGEKNTTIDRIDSNGDYEPLNCRWATYQTQAINRAITIFPAAWNSRKTIRQFSDESGIPYQTIYDRYRRGLYD